MDPLNDPFYPMLKVVFLSFFKITSLSQDSIKQIKKDALSVFLRIKNVSKGSITVLPILLEPRLRLDPLETNHSTIFSHALKAFFYETSEVEKFHSFFSC